MSNDPVKCVECGMLALVDIDKQTIQTCTQEYREKGIARNIRGELHYEARPICAANACDLRTELGQRTAEIEIIGLTHKSRNCDSFVTLIPYLSPKEHMDMRLLQEQREWLRERDKESDERRVAQAAQEHEWRLAQAQRDRDWRNEDTNSEARREDLNHRWRLAELCLIGLLVPASAAFMQYFTTRMQIDAAAKNAVQAHHDEQAAKLQPTPPTTAP